MQFEKLRVREESKELYNNIYEIFTKKSFKDYFFRDQILRATLSISNNIAEGFERETNNELRRFLYISKGSCGEVRNMLFLAYERNYINKEKFDFYYDKCKHISIMLYKYIETL